MMTIKTGCRFNVCVSLVHARCMSNLWNSLCVCVCVIIHTSIYNFFSAAQDKCCFCSIDFVNLCALASLPNKQI